MSCANRHFFSCLIALDRTSSTRLNRNGKSEYPCLVLKGGFQLFIIEYDGCYLRIYHIWSSLCWDMFLPSLIQLFGVFIMNECWVLSMFNICWIWFSILLRISATILGFFYCDVLWWFWYQSNTGVIEHLRNVHCFSIFGGELREVWC